MNVSGRITQLLAADEQVVGHSQQTLLLPDGREGIRVYVRDDRGTVPDHIDGLPVLVEVVGRVEHHSLTSIDLTAQLGLDPRTRTRPLVGGISVSQSPHAPGDGTLGYFVRRADLLLLLTAAHVLTSQGQSVLQPGTGDGGTNDDMVATTDTRVYDPAAGIDAAIARIATGVDCTLDINGLGPIATTGPAALNQVAYKSGRTTGLTAGMVIDTDCVQTVGGQQFQHQIVVDAFAASGFSQGGDSGSLVVARNTAGKLFAIGLITGGSGRISVVNPIGPVLTRLGVTLAV
ncbi:S1 family peptidase [Kineosporia rhizophila]|uniref:S1 family peptidase n=1 Tax=Kineosporia rhizophila TaxID=84633 RepID=UPI001E3C643A|nr:S1 family peptidase [Kineosporia rhizophila]MCE0538652.1 S1 family peptidase [Kineosporia rhizophila]